MKSPHRKGADALAIMWSIIAIFLGALYISPKLAVVLLLVVGAILMSVCIYKIGRLR
jgi:hypothetical protein